MRAESFFVPFFSWTALLAATISVAPLANAPSDRGSAALIYIPGSSVKLYQVNGDCDWVEWDATITSKTPTCKPTTSRTATNAAVLGAPGGGTGINVGTAKFTFSDGNTGTFMYTPTE